MNERKQSVKVVSKSRQPIDIIVLTDYDLSKLKQEFKLADFERQPKWGHVMEIAEAIKEGKLFDPIITWASENDQYEIIDGHNRVEEMRQLGWRQPPRTESS